jgi:hypothetical protein
VSNPRQFVVKETSEQLLQQLYSKAGRTSPPPLSKWRGELPARIASITKLVDGDCGTPGNFSAKWDFAYDGDGIRTSTLYTPYAEGQPQTAVLTAYFPSLLSGRAWAVHTK